MRTEKFIREQIARILSEKSDEEKEEKLPRTSGPGPGRFKKELQDLKALADANPKQLMQNLGIKPAGSGWVEGGNSGEIIINLLADAIKGTKEMSAVYSLPREKKDVTGRVGALVSLTGELSPRDALVFIRETTKGAKNAGYLPFEDEVQVEILGSSILAYVSPKPFRWNQKKQVKKAKSPEPQPPSPKAAPSS